MKQKRGHKSWITFEEFSEALEAAGVRGDGRKLAAMIKRIPSKDLASAIAQELGADFRAPLADVLRVVLGVHDSKRREKEWNHKWNREYKAREEQVRREREAERARKEREQAIPQDKLSRVDQICKIMIKAKSSTFPEEVRSFEVGAAKLMKKHDIRLSWVRARMAHYA